MKGIIRVLLITAGILLIPLLARWPWTLSDFVIMGVLLFSTGLALDLVARKVSKRHRVVIGAAIILTFLLIWAELAVGLFGSPFAGS
jgi:Kef-type K+ transport system membrane component KefB